MNEQYRILITIIRDTAAGKALKLMSSGLVCVYKDEDKAIEAFETYVQSTNFVRDNVTKTTFFGVAMVIDTHDPAKIPLRLELLYGRANG